MLPQPGESFGRYDVHSLLGRGGMGVVYRARHRDLGRDVAVKFLSPDFAGDESYRGRFLREARAPPQLDSPHVVRVHDAGEEGGALFIVTELVGGGNMAGLLTEGGMPIGRAAELVGQVASGLTAAHDAGILHRDIKPPNVLIRPAGAAVQAVLCDFGISTAVDAEATQTVGVIGTPRYMAPERHEGADASVATDIYSLGCLLWAAVTGRAPYDGTASQVILGHVRGEVPQLPGTSRDESAINAILARAMAKAPADRYGSAHEMAEALAAIRLDDADSTVVAAAVNGDAGLEDVTLFGERTIVVPPAATSRPTSTPAAAKPGVPAFSALETARIEQAIAELKSSHDISVSIYLGAAAAPVAATARRLHATLSDPRRSVLILIEPERRVFEIVVGANLGDRLTGPAIRSLASVVQERFRRREFGEGLLAGIARVRGLTAPLVQ